MGLECARWRAALVRLGRLSIRACAVLPVAVIAAIAGSRVYGAQQPPAPAAQLPATAFAEIEALIQEKESRSPIEQKIDSQLIYELKMRSGVAIAAGITRLATDVPYANDGHAIVDVTAKPSSDITATLAAVGAEIVSSSDDRTSIRIHIPIERIETLAAHPDVLFIQPRQEAKTSGTVRRGATSTFNQRARAVARAISSAAGAQDFLTSITATNTGQGSRSSEGDITHLAFAARAAFGARGAGVKIGVLSDGVVSLASSQALGDLGPVTVLPGQAGEGDEGTAMLEIIHDLAPEAQLFFATGTSGIGQFAENIRALQAQGCHIIVDDVFYFVESPFHDGQADGVTSQLNQGIVTQAVNVVTAAGVLYVSSANNSGNLNEGTSGTWEGDFSDGGPIVTPNGASARLHSFGESQVINPILTSSVEPINLYWPDPLGASSSDYDLFRGVVVNSRLVVRAASTNPQSGSQDPFEEVRGPSTPGEVIVITKRVSAQPRFLHLDLNGGRLAIATAGQLHGHAQAAGALAVAATPALAPFPSPFNAGNVVEAFSSDGPRRLFFNAANQPYTPGNLLSTGGIVRQKPDVTAADAVQVTGVGGFGSPFFGTSAAAPHVAAIAALLKSAMPAKTAQEIRQALLATAIDIEAPGVDRDSGAGIIMATDALRALGADGTALVEIPSVQAFDNPGNGNGSPEAGEGARLVLPLANYGNAIATGVTASLATSTRGITIEQESTRSYGNIAIGGSTEAAAFLFTIASEFPCPASASFTLTVNYAGLTNPRVLEFEVPIGVTSYRISKKLDGTAAPASAGVATFTGLQAFRLTRDAIASTCGEQKITPPPATNPPGSTTRQFEAYAFNTCSQSEPSCVTVNLQGTDAINLFSAAYSPSFNPINVQENYRADPGASSAFRTFSFDHPGGGQPFTIDVHDVAPGQPSQTAYTLTVTGACMGACDPPNHVPVAKATDVIVAAGTDVCSADASIDDGSSDADGEALVLKQFPAGPYPLGSTPVLLTVTDSKGAFSQATGVVTVVDQTPPSITNLVITQTPLRTNRDWIAVTVDYDSPDNCSAATCVLSVVDLSRALTTNTTNTSTSGRTGTQSSGTYSDDDDNQGLSFIIADAHHVQLNADRSGKGSSRTYTITVTCTDALGNQTSKSVNVTVRRE